MQRTVIVRQRAALSAPAFHRNPNLLFDLSVAVHHEPPLSLRMCTLRHHWCSTTAGALPAQRISTLDVKDINLGRRRPQPHGPHDLYEKGDPAGPRRPKHVHPRLKAEDMDNSLRTFDIIGVRCVCVLTSVILPGATLEICCKYGAV